MAAHSAEREICWKNIVRSVVRKPAHAVKTEYILRAKGVGGKYLSNLVSGGLHSL